MTRSSGRADVAAAKTKAKPTGGPSNASAKASSKPNQVLDVPAPSAGVQQNEKSRKQTKGKEVCSMKLSGGPSRNENKMMPVPKSHPLATLSVAQGHSAPCVSLEQWFDGGIIGGPGRLNGARILPSGYHGLTEDKILLESAKAGTFTWPVRIDIGHIGGDDLKPFTLYHYTHTESFKKLAAIFQGGDSENLQDDVLSVLKEDFQERVASVHPMNLKGEPQLSAVEPAKFNKKHDILHHIFGKEPSGFTRHGHKCGEFADYCLAVRVPASCCIDLTGHITGHAAIKISLDTLEALARRVEARRQVARERASSEQAKKKKANPDKEDKKQSACRRLCAWLCCVDSPDAKKPEYWDEDDNDAQLESAEMDNSKLGRGVDYHTSRETHHFVKNHFVGVTERQEKEREKKKEAAVQKVKDLRRKVEISQVEDKKKVKLNVSKQAMATANQEKSAVESVLARRIGALENALADLKEIEDTEVSALDAESRFLTFGHKADAAGAVTWGAHNAANKEMKTRPVVEDLRVPTGKQRGERAAATKQAAKQQQREDSPPEVAKEAPQKTAKSVKLNTAVEVQMLGDDSQGDQGRGDLQGSKGSKAGKDTDEDPGE